MLQKHSHGDALLDEVFGHLNILERDYFGLSYIDDRVTVRWRISLVPVLTKLFLTCRGGGGDMRSEAHSIPCLCEEGKESELVLGPHCGNIHLDNEG